MPLDLTRLRRLGTQRYFPQSAIEEATGPAYAGAPGVQERLAQPGDPGLNAQGYWNPYKTVMYSITGIDTANVTRALNANQRRCYIIVQNLGPGNLFVGIGIDPVAGGQNVLNLVTTQLYEQIGGGFLGPDGYSRQSSFVSPEYISLLSDTAGTAAMILEGTYQVPPNLASHFQGLEPIGTQNSPSGMGALRRR